MYNIVKNENVNNYLNNILIASTMTSYTLEPTKQLAIYPGFISSDGYIVFDYGVRPVIILEEKNNILSGNGSMLNPYKLLNEAPVAVSDEKLNTRYSGEFISYGEKLFRIMEVSNGLTKVIYDGGELLIPKGVFGSNNLDWNTSKMKLDSAPINTSKIALNQTWQRGYYIGTGGIESSLAPGNAVTSTFGFVRVGEMWASLTNKKTTNYNKFIKDYWTMTPTLGTSDYLYGIRRDAAAIILVSSSLDYRPCFFFKEDITIKGGQGTPNNPYILN